jgi:peptidoglycan/LPS O-acetylase OafA/YrhL
MGSASTTRSARIDFLRGVAIFAVLLHHFSLTYHLVDSPLSLILPAGWVRAAVVNGNYGVTIFFVISGFLISSNNLRRYERFGNVNLRQFYAFRFSRIIPPLILALTVIVALGVLGVPSFSNSDGGRHLPPSFFLIAVLSVLTFWHNVLMEMVGYFNYCLNIYWSLSVEEVFYLTFPLACVLLKRNLYIVGLCALAIAAGPIYRFIHRDDELYFMYGYAACFDAIAFGCLMALLHRKIAIGRNAGRVLRGMAGIGLAAVYFAGIDGHEVWGFTLIAVCSACLLVNAFDADDEKLGARPTRMVGWLGRHSYELYLFHIVVLAGMRDLVPKETLASAYKLPLFALFLLLSALAAAGVSRHFAEPLNARLRRILGKP